MTPVEFDKEFKEFQKKYSDYCDFLDFLSYKLYPKVFDDYFKFNAEYGYATNIPTKAFFYGLDKGEEILVNIGEGKTIMVKLLYVLEPDENGMALVGFELNGQVRRIQVRDRKYKSSIIRNRKATNDKEIGAPLQGKISSILVKVGDEVDEDQPLFTIEAMKMESTITASVKGKVKSVPLSDGVMVEQDDMIVEFE